MSDRNLATYTRASEYQTKEATHLAQEKQKYACPDIDVAASEKGNLPLCRHGGTICNHPYEAELTATCPTFLIYNGATQK